jgi:hypothetical protein
MFSFLEIIIKSTTLALALCMSLFFSVANADPDNLNYLYSLGFSPAVAERIAGRPDLVIFLRTLGDGAKVIRVYRGMGIEPSEFNPTKLGQNRQIWIAKHYLWPPLGFLVRTFRNKSNLQNYFGTMVEYEIPEALLKGTSTQGHFAYGKLPNRNKDVPFFVARISRVNVERAFYELVQQKIERPIVFSADVASRPLFDWQTYSPAALNCDTSLTREAQ